jgi:hypothetical protein
MNAPFLSRIVPNRMRTGYFPDSRRNSARLFELAIHSIIATHRASPQRVRETFCSGENYERKSKMELRSGFHPGMQLRLRLPMRIQRAANAREL